MGFWAKEQAIGVMVMFSSDLIFQEFFNMNPEINRPNMARLEVQQRFCENCSSCIKKELQRIDTVNNIRLFPKDSLIVFNFKKAIDLSNVLNTLSDIGYPEKIGGANKESHLNTYCKC